MDSALLKMKCKNCGAEYNLNTRGELHCLFCGAIVHLTDKDYEEYLKTRDEILIKEKFKNDNTNKNGDVLDLWISEKSYEFTKKDGSNITINYYYHVNNSKVMTLIGKNSIVSICADNYFKKVDKIQFPSADIKGLHKYLPNVVSINELNNFNQLIIIDKPENIYPLAIFDKLDAKQVAWIISRLENLACLFEYNQVDFEQITKNDLYINPKTHELFLLGGWNTFKNHQAPKTFLNDMRKIALDILDLDTAPKMCIDFLNSSPASDAYTDFSNWDNVIEVGFGGHNFHKFDES